MNFLIGEQEYRAALQNRTGTESLEMNGKAKLDTRAQDEIYDVGVGSIAKKLECALREISSFSANRASNRAAIVAVSGMTRVSRFAKGTRTRMTLRKRYISAVPSLLIPKVRLGHLTGNLASPAATADRHRRPWRTLFWMHLNPTIQAHCGLG
ncbi:hypothetical protein [Novipirellula caenicola]|uniref:Uncharacterized protein n=1 Tax=Novipirellula caenicola TaxID=1536901 RepID=A0ABP9VX01_9BACT